MWHSNPLWNEVSEMLDMFTQSITDTHRHACLLYRNENVCIPAPQPSWLGTGGFFRCWHVTTHCPPWLQCTWSPCIPWYSWILTDRSCIILQHGLTLRSLTSHPTGKSSTRQGHWALAGRMWTLSSAKEWREKRTERSPSLYRHVCEIDYVILRSQYSSQWIPGYSDAQHNNNTEICDLFVLAGTEEDKSKAGDKILLYLYLLKILNFVF